MLTDMSGAFTASEADFSQTGGNFHILHFELDYFFAFALFLQEVFLRNLDQFEKGQVTLFSHSGQQLYKKSYVRHYPLQNNDLI